MAVSLVQSATSTHSTSSPITITWSSNTNTGDLIVVAISISGSNSNTVTGITDSQSNTYTRLDNNNGASPNFEFWYAANITGGTTPTITISRTGSFTWDAIAQEFSGLTASPLDVHNFTTGTTGATLTSPSVTTTSANELLIGWGGPLGSGQTITAAGTGYSNLYQVNPLNDSTIALESQVVSSTGSYSASMTRSSSSGSWLEGIATFVAASSSDDSVSVAETTASTEALAGYSDQVATREQIGLMADANPRPTDSITAAESLSVQATEQVLVSDGSTTSESVSVLPSGSGISVADTTSATEAVAVLAAPSISLSDSATLAETVVIQNTKYVQVTDNITTTESVGLFVSNVVGVSETLAASDTSSIVLGSNIMVGDTGTTAESVALNIPTLLLSVSENVSSADNNLTLLDQDGVAVLEATTSSETVSIYIPVLYAAVSDTVSALETTTLYLSYSVATTDTVSVVDAFGGQQFDYFAIDESVVATDTIDYYSELVLTREEVTVEAQAPPVNPQISLNESVTTTESATVLIPFYLLSRTETAATAEVDVASFSLAIQGADNASATEFISLQTATNVSASDTATVADSPTVLIPVILANAQESVVVADSYLIILEQDGIGVIESLISLDTVAITIPLTINATDSVNIAEGTSIASIALVNELESVTLAEATTSLLTGFIAVSESVTTSEQTTETGSGTLLSASDSSSVIETVSISVQIGAIDVNDTASLTESVNQLIPTLYESVADSTTATESTSLLNVENVSATDAATVNETTTEVVTNYISTNDSVNTSDTPREQITVSVSVADGVTSTDSAVAYIPLYLVTITESSTITESTAVLISGNGIFATDSTSVAETVGVLLPTIQTTVSDSSSTADVPTLQPVSYISKAESTTATEAVSLTVVNGISISSSVVLAEATVVHELNFTNTAEPVTVGESLTVAINVPPNAPTLITPVNSGTATSVEPTLEWSDTDNNNDNITYEVQVDTVNTFDSQGGLATPALVQQVGGNDTTGSGGSVSIAYPTNNTVGNMLYVVIAQYGSSVSSFGDTAGNSWHLIYSHTAGLNNIAIRVYVAYNCLGGANTISFSDSGKASTMIIGEVSGIASTVALDAQATNEDFGTTTPSVGPTSTLAEASEFVLAIVDTSDPTSSYTVGTGYGNGHQEVANNVSLFLESKVVSSTSGVSATATLASYVTTNSYLFTFKALSTPTAPLIDAFSGTGGHDAGQFADVTNAADTDPFASGDTISFVVPVAEQLLNTTTYYWRVRGLDPNGSNTWGSWSATYRFTVDTGSRAILVSDSVSVTETIVLAAEFHITVTDAATTTDTCEPLVTSFASISDATIATDAMASVVANTIHGSDAISITEQPSVLTTSYATVNDTVSTIEGVVPQLYPVMLTVAEAVATSEHVRLVASITYNITVDIVLKNALINVVLEQKDYLIQQQTTTSPRVVLEQEELSIVLHSYDNINIVLQGEI